MRKEDFYDGAQTPERRIGIGDKVRFLNSVGGGRVTAFHGHDQVLVEDDNGFDFPVLISECVVVGEADRKLCGTEATPYTAPNIPAAKDTAPPTKPVRTERAFEETPAGERLNLSLAFLPTDPKAFTQTAFETYIINESNYYMYINYMSCSNRAWTSRYHGLVEPDTKVFVEEFDKQSVNGMEHICLQAVAFKRDKPFTLKPPAAVELRLDTVKFYKMHCFTENDFFDDDALIVPVIVDDTPERPMIVSAEEVRCAMLERKRAERREPQPAAKKGKPRNEPLEIDLHIDQIVDTTAGMNNSDMLNCQLSKFHETMKANIASKGKKIIFIHGKGEGVLRSAIEKELKSTYRKQSIFQDASFREYGFGATQVTII